MKVIQVPITEAELKFAKAVGDKVPFLGAGHIRADMEERVRKFREDQITGQLGNILGTKFLFGGYHPYKLSRWFVDLDPKRGDGGSDVPGAGIDFKATRMRYSKDPYFYSLCVRPAERHINTTYILIPVDLDNMVAYINGWATEDMLPETVEASGPLAGAFVLHTNSLNPMMPMFWFS